MEPIALVFFMLFSLTILTMYIVIRRGIVPTGIAAAVGVLASIVMMMLFSLAQRNVFGQALVVGILVGGAFSLAALAIAMYFQGQELQADDLLE